MPFVNTKVTVKITEEQEKTLKEEMGKAMSLVGKSEAYLMVGFEDNCRLWFGGNNDGETAFVDIALLGSVSKENATLLTKEICSVINRVLSIPADRVYVKFTPTEVWGYNNFVF